MIDFIPATRVESEAYEDAFLIADLLTTRLTVLSGEPKAGKSHLAAAMATALLRGDEEFLGQRVMASAERIMFGLTDDGADSELKARLPVDVHDRVYVARIDPYDFDGTWLDLSDAVIDAAPDLFVLDNMLGMLSGTEDVASTTVARDVINRIRPITAAGVPVLMVTHTPKGSGEGHSVASSPIGGRAIAAGARGIIALRKSKRGRHLETAINRAKEELNLPVQMESVADGSEVASWRLNPTTEAERGQRRAPSKDWSTLALRIVSDNPAEATLRGVAKRYAEGAGASAETVRRHLGDLVEHDGSAWVAKGEPALRVA